MEILIGRLRSTSSLWGCMDVIKIIILLHVKKSNKCTSYILRKEAGDDQKEPRITILGYGLDGSIDGWLVVNIER